MYDNLSESLKEYAKKETDQSLRQYYNDTADALADEEFIKTLVNTDTGNRLEALQGNIRGYGNSLASYISSTNSYNEALHLVHASFIAHRVDKKRNISVFSQKIREFESQIQESEERISEINRIANILSGAEILEAYANDFDRQATKHRDNSLGWLRFLIASVAGLVIIVASLLFIQISNFPVIKEWLANDIKSIGMLNNIALVIKGSIIMAYIQIPLFIRKNYFAEKHLEQSLIHRRNVLKALHAVYKTINNQEEKDKIITVGATIAFSEPESGFITRKEGAGGDDNLEAILKIIGK